MPLVVNYIKNNPRKYYKGEEKTPLGRGYSSFFEKPGTVKKGKDNRMYKVILINNTKKWIPLKNQRRNPKGLFSLSRGGYVLDPTVEDLYNEDILFDCDYFPLGYSFKLVHRYSLDIGFDEPLFTTGLITCSALLFTDSNDEKNYIFHDSETAELWNNRAIDELKYYKRTPKTAYIILSLDFSIDTLTKYLTNLEINYYIFYPPNDRYNFFTGIEDDKLLCARYDGDSSLLWENMNPDGSVDVNIR